MKSGQSWPENKRNPSSDVLATETQQTESEYHVLKSSVELESISCFKMMQNIWCFLISSCTYSVYCNCYDYEV